MSLGVGIYGCGFIGEVHAYCYKNMSIYYNPPALNPELIGVCTSQQKTAEKAKEKFGFIMATTDYHELLNRDDIDIVHCCTPNYLHYEFIMEAIKARKHIYCEKPLALNYEQAREIREFALKSKYNQKFQITHNYRYLPAILRAKQLVEEGFLGQVFGFRAQYLHSGYIDKDRPLSWRLDKQQAGSGALGDLGTHVLDLIYHLLGPYNQVMAEQETFIKERYSAAQHKNVPVEVDDVTISMVRMANGALGTIEAWRFATGAEDELRIEIHGSNGAMRFNLMDPNWLEVYDNREIGEPYGGNRGWKKISTVQKYPKPAIFPSTKAPIGWIRSHVESLHTFLLAIAEDKKTHPSLADGVYIQKTHDKLLKSAHNGHWEKVSFEQE